MAPITRLTTPRFSSPILRRLLTQTPKPQQSRPLSIAQRLRTTIREFEPHPFERYPKSAKAAPADYGRLFRRVGDAAMFYVPGMALVLGWPVMVEQVLDGRM